MLIRVLIAGLGALIVTAGLLLGMDAATSLFERASGERFFRITDILPKPEPGRPVRPEAASRQPPIVEPDVIKPDPGLTVEAPPAVETAPERLQGPEIGPADAQPD